MATPCQLLSLALYQAALDLAPAPLHISCASSDKLFSPLCCGLLLFLREISPTFWNKIL
jgi:hypothetical protein